MFNDAILKSEEKAVFALRSIYTRFGYSRFKMNKFEEYDLYSKMKDSLISDGVITFTDTNGKLLALKPDVTLSIIKNSTDKKGVVQKLYYDESVYRVSGSSKTFKEITQTGLEVLGDISLYDVSEVLILALKSLETISEDFILDIAHASLFCELLRVCELSDTTHLQVIEAIKRKSRDAVYSLQKSGEISESAADITTKLIANYKDLKALNAAFCDIKDDKVQAALAEMLELVKIASELGFSDKLNIDFSIVNASGYYSGVVFKGYIKGIPTEVLSGGRYDKLMKKMGKSSGAVGFAVYLDSLQGLSAAQSDYDYDFVLLTDDGCDPCDVLEQVETLSSNGSSVAVFRNIPEGVRYRNIIKMTANGLEA
ncbi:MAG: hypothetical protein E7525_02120 [Ruminococcaceae bacterium]|nr:hypothetical protein [Oscillospiraceae bacterium]